MIQIKCAQRWFTVGSSVRARRRRPERLLSPTAGDSFGSGRGRGDGEDRAAGEVERALGTSDRPHVRYLESV